MTATGHGCSPRAPVELTVARTLVGRTSADGNGSYATPLHVGSLPVGRYQVVAHCGLLVTAAGLDVILATQGDPDTATMLIIVFFLLIGLALFRRRIRLTQPVPTPRPGDHEDGDATV